MAFALMIKGPDGVERQLDIERNKVTIGANPLCDVTVADPGVDAEQCVLVERGDAVELFDIGESGGVLVNGKPVGHAEVAPGDEIWVGGTVLSLLAAAGAVSFVETVSTVREEIAAPSPAAVRSPVPRDARFALLEKVEKLIRSIGTDENVFEAILDTVFSSAEVRRGFISLLGPGRELRVKAHRSRERGTAATERIEVSRTLIGKVIDSGTAVLTSDAEADSNFSAAQSIHRLRIKAAICVPLIVEGKVIGLLYGDNREKPGSLTRDHLSILTALASVAAVAVEKFRLLKEYDEKRKIEQALAIARTIQRRFLPAHPPEIEGLDIWGRSDSCDETGGDYYDFFPARDGSLRVVVADVTGHGVGPALLMATVRAALRVLVDSEPSLEKLLYRLNNLIRSDVNDGRFITLFMGRIDPRSLTFGNVGAGHTPPVWYRARDKTTHLVTSKGPPLGIVRGMEFQPGTSLPLAKGDLLLFTTDGIIEADRASGEQFGFARLRAVVTQNAHLPARELVDAVLASVGDFTQGRPLRDDSTLVAVKIV